MFYDITPQGYILRIRVMPNSSKYGCSGFIVSNTGEKYLKISLHAIPEKGKANKELIAFLSKSLKQSKSSFKIVSGETDRNKKILLDTELSPITEEKLKQLENANDSANH